jgi:3-oxoacyl-[acyl-carrier-protein] synthase I
MALALTSMGLLSSVGHDVVTACAAIRAGIVRPVPIVGTDVLDLQNGEMVPITGHPLRGVTEGFLFLGLWVRMAERAIRDLLSYGRLPESDQSEFWRTCELMVVTPTLEPARFSILDEPVDTALLKEDYADTLLELTGLSIPPKRVHSFPAGHVGVATALETAARIIEGGHAKRCLIVAVDSYLEPDTLDWLASHNRLKHGDNPVGMMPGEAGAALLLEAPRAVEERRGPIDAWVQSVALADTGWPRDAKGAPRDGIVLADLLASVLPTTTPFRGDLIADLNGEEWRAREFGGALARLGRTLAEARVVLPAASLGDVGAASGGVGVCVAARAFARGYARSHESVVMSLAETGRVAAIRLVHPDKPGTARQRTRG